MANKGNRAAVPIVDAEGYSIGYADRDVPGYTPTTYSYPTYEEASRAADMMNQDVFNLTPREASEITLSTLTLR